MKSNPHSDTIEKLAQELMGFNLTPNEAKTLIALWISPQSSAPELINMVCAGRTECYNHLKSLEQKGLVFTTQEKGSSDKYGKRYYAMPINATIEFLRAEKEQEIKEAMQKASTIHEVIQSIAIDESRPPKEIKDVFQLLSSKIAVSNGLARELPQAKESVEMLVCTKDSHALEFDFIQELNKLGGRDLQVLVKTESDDFMKELRPPVKARYLQSSSPSNIVIIDGKELFVFWRVEREVKGFYTNIEGLTASFQAYFDKV